MGSTHMCFGHPSGILDLAEEHLHLVHVPAQLQLLLLGPLGVVDRIIRLQQQVLSLGLLQVEVRSRVMFQTRA